MIVFNSFTTYKKITSLVVLFGFLFALLFSGLFYYIHSTKKTNFATGQNNFHNEISALLKLKSEPLEQIVKDLTYWDVFVDYFNNPSQFAFYDNIGSTTESYDIDFMGAYDIEGNLLHSSNSEGFDINTLELSPELFKKIYTDRDIKFYKKSNNNVVEVYASTVHPTADSKKNKTDPSGFLIVIRVLDKEYYDNITSVSGATLQKETYINEDDEFFSCPIQYADFDGSPVDRVTFLRPSYVDYEDAYTILYILLIVFILYIIIYVSIAVRWVRTPLNHIRNVLSKNDENALEKLEHSSVDFKEIAALFRKAEKRKLDLEEAKVKAEESDKLKSSFLANLSHEIRTPMNAILGFSELLEEDEVSEAEKKEYLKIMQQSGSNLISIIDDLIEMSKIDVNQLTPNKTIFNLDTTLEELVESLKVTIPDTKPVHLHLIKPTKAIPQPVISDEVKIKQILTNLITNGLKFTEKGAVTVSYYFNENDKAIHFSIADTGKGISASEQKVIFERFRQVEDDFTVESGGLGLGLAISKAYVEMLGGSIQLESELGNGTTFTFSIPITLTTKTQKVIYNNAINIKPNTKITFNPSEKLILVAEDDNINYLLINKLLTDMGYNIIRAANGIEAVNICKTNDKIDLAIMDIKMPYKDGFEARKEIVAFAPELPMIAHTAFASQEDRQRTEVAGFAGHITKPLKKEILYNLLQELLHNRSKDRTFKRYSKTIQQKNTAV